MCIRDRASAAAIAVAAAAAAVVKKIASDSINELGSPDSESDTDYKRDFSDSESDTEYKRDFSDSDSDEETDTAVKKKTKEAAAQVAIAVAAAAAAATKAIATKAIATKAIANNESLVAEEGDKDEKIFILSEDDIIKEHKNGETLPEGAQQYKTNCGTKKENCFVTQL